MKVYLVGGAVRDQLLNRIVKERDWVVVGETPAKMLVLGFTQVGKDFPVFLHPETKEEYALARKERKVSKGYTGFEFDASASVSLEEDLLRRDLTINAIAQEQEDQGKLIDPYGGVKDLERKLLRHVSPAFVEDPVRILRVARFAARFPEFLVADETNNLMQEMVNNGEVDALVPERVWKEFERALGETAPWRFIEVLYHCGALQKIFPALYKVYADAVKILKTSRDKTELATERFVLLMQVVKQIDEMEKLCEAYKLPQKLARMASLVRKYRDKFLTVQDASSEELLNTLQSLDAFRREERFQEWLRLCQLASEMLDNQQNKSFENYAYCYQQSLAQLQSVAVKPEQLKDLKGHEVGNFISSKRLEALDQILPNLKQKLH